MLQILNIIKTVQALMLIIDFTTPEWVKNLILSLHPIKNMQKHFELPNYDPARFIMQFKEAKEINHQKIEIHTENATSKKMRNEFDESSERSAISQSAKVSYDQIIEQKLKPEELASNEKIDAVMQIFSFLLSATACGTDINPAKLEYNNDLEFNNKSAIINCSEDYKIFDQYNNFEQVIIGNNQLIDGY